MSDEQDQNKMDWPDQGGDEEQPQGNAKGVLPEEESSEEEESEDAPLMNEKEAWKELERWLHEKRIKGARKQKLHDQLAELVTQIQDGYLEVVEEEDKGQVRLKQKLRLPIGERVQELYYWSRVSPDFLDGFTKGIPQDDIKGQVVGYVAGLTEKPPSIIRKMDTEDYRVAQVISSFFM